MLTAKLRLLFLLLFFFSLIQSFPSLHPRSRLPLENGILEFTDTVLPKLFKHCKFASFVRQLNIYGFQRDTDARKYKEPKDRESCRWYHVNFRPGRRDLFHLIRRKTSVCNKRRRRSSQLVKAEALDTETIIPVGSDSEHDDYYENMQRSGGIEDKRQLQDVTKRSMVLNSPLASMHQQQQQSDLNVNLSSRKHAMVMHCDDNNTLYLKQQILELKQMCQSMEKTFAHEIARAQEQIHTQKQQLDMIQSVVESLRQPSGKLSRQFFLWRSWHHSC
ncbi:hypothetical protein BC943DRAFT_29081 [Umbelopsis sp. AD052]|nr:hypothetical protein BC943DRAFT_29081 [Umbelopsis sp. AD052]